MPLVFSGTMGLFVWLTDMLNFYFSTPVLWHLCINDVFLSWWDLYWALQFGLDNNTPEGVNPQNLKLCPFSLVPVSPCYCCGEGLFKLSQASFPKPSDECAQARAAVINLQTFSEKEALPIESKLIVPTQTKTKWLLLETLSFTVL